MPAKNLIQIRSISIKKAFMFARKIDVSSCQLGYGSKCSLGGACKAPTWAARRAVHDAPLTWACPSRPWKRRVPTPPMPPAGGLVSTAGGRGGWWWPPAAKNVPTKFFGLVNVGAILTFSFAF